MGARSTRPGFRELGISPSLPFVRADFGSLGTINSKLALSMLIADASDIGSRRVIIAMAVNVDRRVRAFHASYTTAYARELAARLIDCADFLDGGGAVQ